MIASFGCATIRASCHSVTRRYVEQSCVRASVDERPMRAEVRVLATKDDVPLDGYDVVALGNLCVDVLLPPAPIPEEGALKTKKMLDTIAKTAPERDS